MPRAGKAKQIDPGAVYVAWQGAAVDIDGTPHTVAAGERRLGSDPVVREHGWLFVADGVPRSEWPSAHADTVEQQEREKRIAEADFQVRTLEPPALLDPSLYVRCKRRLRVGHGPNREGLPESVSTIKAGQVLLRDQQVVEKSPSNFEDFELPKGRR